VGALHYRANPADTDCVTKVRGLLTLRVCVGLLIPLVLAGCAGSSNTASGENYPLVESTPPELQPPVTMPNGSVVRLPVLPNTYETEPSASCEREMATFHDGSRPTRRPIVVPPAPGLRAIAVTEHRTRLEWSFRDLPDDCRPVVIRLSVVAGKHPGATPTNQEVPISAVTGSTQITYPDFLPSPDVAHASSYSRDGHRSRTVSVLIRRSADTPADPPEPAPPVTAPAGEPISCDGRQTTVDDPTGDVLAYAPGSPPTRVPKLTRALSGIDITRASVQVDGRAICAVLVFAKSPETRDFQLTLNLHDTTTRSCCAALRFRQTSGRHEVGRSTLDAHGYYRLEPVQNAGASLRGTTLVMTGTLPALSAWPAAKNVGWALTTKYSPDKYGPYYGDWLPRYEASGEPIIRQRDGATVKPSVNR
jgi:hypothetical protein